MSRANGSSTSRRLPSCRPTQNSRICSERSADEDDASHDSRAAPAAAGGPRPMRPTRAMPRGRPAETLSSRETPSLRDGDPARAGALGGSAALRALGVYIHIPFCAARCPYCDFATAPARSALRSRYLDALDSEIRREGLRLGKPRVSTVFFGGGTPSLLEPVEIARLGTALRDSLDLRPVEASVEANPATLDRARLEAWAALGITRLSLGAQSFSPVGLRALGRTHQPEDIAPAVAAARSVGFDVNLDLIFGWP